jgi:hypothetical protein
MNRSAQTLLAAAFCTFGWLSSFTYAFHLIGPYVHPCGDGDTLPYLVSMIAGPATLSLAAMTLTIGSGLGVTVRWPCLLHVFTLAVAGYLLPSYLVNTTIEGHFICVSNAAGGPVDFPAAPWQRVFVPVQNAALVLFGIFLVWYWRRRANAGNGAEIE